MTRKIGILFSLLSASTFVTADDLGERVGSLESRVTALERGTRNSCLSRTDGFVLEGKTRDVVQDASGKWIYEGGLSDTFNGNFGFQINKEFRTPEGQNLLVVTLYAPGFKRECTHRFLAKSDVFLY